MFCFKGRFTFISWTLNGHNIVNKDGVVTASMNRRNSILTIESAQAYHTGEYTCLAENIVGVAKYSSYLNVKGTFTVRILTVRFSAYYFPYLSFILRPVFLLNKSFKLELRPFDFTF